MAKVNASRADASDDEAPTGFAAVLAAYLDDMTPLERARLEHAERVDRACAGLTPEEALRLERAMLESER